VFISLPHRIPITVNVYCAFTECHLSPYFFQSYCKGLLNARHNIIVFVDCSSKSLCCEITVNSMDMCWHILWCFVWHLHCNAAN